jgi:hypothetical protein
MILGYFTMKPLTVTVEFPLSTGTVTRGQEEEEVIVESGLLVDVRNKSRL